MKMEFEEGGNLYIQEAAEAITRVYVYTSLFSFFPFLLLKIKLPRMRLRPWQGVNDTYVLWNLLYWSVPPVFSPVGKKKFIPQQKTYVNVMDHPTKVISPLTPHLLRAYRMLERV